MAGQEGLRGCGLKERERNGEIQTEQREERLQWAVW